jgi:site-specific DNA-adenine methylase
MKPMFSYMGSKWRIAKKYGAPRTNIVIEPFAGAACYSLYWNAPNVILCDINPIIAGIWRYLIDVKESEILSLPIDFATVDDLKIPEEAKWLIGFWITKGNVHPNKSRSAWARQYRNSGDCKVWSESVRVRIAKQVSQIRGWKIYCGDYRKIDNLYADWFIDPPYVVSGKHYPFSELDYNRLTEFCLSRNGFTTVCGQQGEEWLDFHPLVSARAMTGKNVARISYEAVYQSKGELPSPIFT